MVIVEAEYRSGSSITAKYARKSRKPVFAVPNNIYAKTGVGTNRLIQEGAILLTSPEQIIKTVKPSTIIKNHTNNEKETNKNIEKYSNDNKIEAYINSEKKIKEEYKNIEKEKSTEKKSKKTVIPKEYITIYKVLSGEPIHVNELAKKLTKTVQEIIPIITMMEIDGYVYQTQNNYFVRNI